MRAWLDGVEVADPSPPATSGPPGPGLGAGVFETLRVADGRPFALSRHLCRMATSAAETDLPAVDLAFVRDVVTEVCADVEVPSRLRLTWSRGPGVGDGAGLLGLTTSVLPASEAAVRLVTVPWRRAPGVVLAGHKATSYAENLLGAAYARRHGADEGVFLTPDGRVSEGSATNVFHVVGDRVRTSSPATGCLPGITRALVLEWFDAHEVDADEDEVRTADEVFVTSSTRGPVPVRSWDGRSWSAPGPVTTSLVQEWSAKVVETPDP